MFDGPPAPVHVNISVSPGIRRVGNNHPLVVHVFWYKTLQHLVVVAMRESSPPWRGRWVFERTHHAFVVSVTIEKKTRSGTDRNRICGGKCKIESA